MMGETVDEIRPEIRELAAYGPLPPYADDVEEPFNLFHAALCRVDSFVLNDFEVAALFGIFSEDSGNEV